jgi:hypothetical protein
MRGYKLYGYGVVTKDIEVNDKYATIAIYEAVSGNETFDNSDTTIDEKSGVVSDATGFKTTKHVKREMTVEALWLNEGSTRINIPMMSMGELVKVYNYDGTDRFYFKPHHLEKDLRRKEVVIHAFSNLDKEKNFGQSFDESTSYHFMVDTVNKLSRFKTATNDGEPVLWEILLDSGKGKLSILVNGKEKIVLDGVSDKLTINVKDTILNGSTLLANLSNTFTLVASKFLNKSRSMIVYATTTVKKSVDFKSKCKFNMLSKTGVKKEPLE